MYDLHLIFSRYIQVRNYMFMFKIPNPHSPGWDMNSKTLDLIIELILVLFILFKQLSYCGRLINVPLCLLFIEGETMRILMRFISNKHYRTRQYFT